MNELESTPSNLPFDAYEGLSLHEIVHRRKGLPLLARNSGEIDQDYLIETFFRESAALSITRRPAKKYQSRSVVDLLDTLDETMLRVGALATEYIAFQNFIMSQPYEHSAN